MIGSTNPPRFKPDYDPELDVSTSEFPAETSGAEAVQRNIIVKRLEFKARFSRNTLGGYSMHNGSDNIKNATSIHG